METVCCFCGSRMGDLPEYEEAAKALGEELLRRGTGLIYGGGDGGLMGIVSRTVRAGSGRVVGVIPRIWEKEAVNGEMVVEDMHQRKALMAKHASCFVALPGGLGTLEELAEMGTWLTLGMSFKPVGILNTAGFYDPLLAMFDKAHASGFQSWGSSSLNSPFIVRSDPVELLDALGAAIQQRAAEAAALAAAPAEEAL